MSYPNITRFKKELLVACGVAVHEYLATMRGAGFNATVTQIENVLQVKVPTPQGPVYFEIKVVLKSN